jgi:hypothetical protein
VQKRFVDGISDEQYKSGVFMQVKRVNYQVTWLTRALFTLIEEYFISRECQRGNSPF